MAAPDFGIDIDMTNDLPLIFGVASGQRNVANAVARRYQCPRGALVYDPEYGYDVRPFANITLTPAALSQLRSDMIAEARKDERVQDCDIVLTPPPSLLGTLFANVTLTTSNGPFELILAISSVTVDILDIGGTLATPIIPGSGAVIAGPPGLAGVAGPAGPAGANGTPSITLDQDAQIADTSGAEVLIYQAAVNFGSLPAGTLTAEITAQIMAAAGTATFRVRLGGTDRAVDGTVLATMTTTSATFARATANGTFTNPTGIAYVKVTEQTSSPGNAAGIRGMVTTIR